MSSDTLPQPSRTISRADALALDAADPLRGLRSRFTLPDGVLYLDGNSLGALPAHTPDRIAGMVAREWGEGLIRSWNEAGWYDLPRGLGERIAPLVGAATGQVVVCDSTSVNLFKVLTAALRLRPDRRVIVSELGSFPTDLYLTEGVTGGFGGGPAEGDGSAEGGGYRRRLLGRDSDRLEELIGEDTAVVLLSHVDYRTGALQDMAAVTELAHRHGALIVWDLCHSAGALPVRLDACGADFAVGCSYKYLNGGPGAPAFLYAAARHLEDSRQPLTGWFGHAEPFAFEAGYRPAEGIGRFLTGTPPLLSLAGLEAALDIWDDVDLDALRAKSLALTSLFLELTAPLGLESATPAEPDRRGSQVSLRHPQAYPVMQALIARGVIGDYRAPDVLRFGFTPLYLSHADVWDAAEALRQVLDSGEWREARFAAAAGAVT
ncbi:kynureninase [Streptacidiphilus sp. PB12-B1b]|uniref:kynureninase n=1 Tax=Streptacidiphilus sp. PB12-B1b TaxID=2705012 RepID=UPI0015FAEB96|nr:kynureninase [Streptacidiphilus sp. PB12-B1b]QMU74908.1 kynureninase [Streptacidiphilus sp. PB12-B1b]